MGKKFVPIQLDKMRNFRYGMQALEIIEDLTGKSAMKMDFENMGIKTLKYVIYAGLVHEDKELKPETILELIDEYSDLETVSKAMSEALKEAFGKNAVGAARANKPMPENGTGIQP